MGGGADKLSWVSWAKLAAGPPQKEGLQGLHRAGLWDGSPSNCLVHSQGWKLCSTPLSGDAMETAEPCGRAVGPVAGTGGSWLTRIVSLAAGRTTTSEELEDMLESGNPAIFSSGVSTGTG